MATYDITIHPADGSSQIDLPSFKGPDDLTEAVHEITRRVTARRPRPDMDDRVQVKTNNPAWKNNYQGPVADWIPGVLHGDYKSEFNA